MYAAIAKNGEPINGIKAGSPASLSLSLRLDISKRMTTGSGRDTNHRFHDSAK